MQEASLVSLLAELEAFGAANDAAHQDRPRRMLNITRDTGELLAVKLAENYTVNAVVRHPSAYRGRTPWALPRKALHASSGTTGQTRWVFTSQASC